MKKLLLLIFLLSYFAFFNSAQVTTNGRDILVDGVKYKMKGVCYNSIKKGNDRTSPFDYNYLDVDIALMKEAGINTIRIYSPLDNKDFFDKMIKAGIRVIVGFSNFDDTKQYADIKNDTYLKYIEKYKDHPAILLWELGNEYNYHPEWFNNDMKNWYKILNDAAAEVKKIDANHPVATAHGEVPTKEVLNLCKNIDVWGMNVYRWDNPSSAAAEFADLSKLPCYFSEAGCDRYDSKSNTPDSENHSKGVYNTLKNTFNNPNVSGLCLFEWNDEWWKAKGKNDVQDKGGFSFGVPYDRYSNEEWYGVVDIERNTTLAYDNLRYYYTGKFMKPKNKKGETFKVSTIITNGKFELEFPREIKKGELSIIDSEPIIYGMRKIRNKKSMKVKLKKKESSMLKNGVYYINVHDENGKMSQRIVFIKK